MTPPQQIQQQLAQIQQQQQVYIPIAIESGSRAWGFASPDSDYDCRFIFVRPAQQYLTVFAQEDTIQFPPDPLLDVSGWDVRKVLEHLVKSNATLHEWLRSPLQYRMEEPVRQQLLAVADAFFNPVAVGWHYLSMAKNKLAQLESQPQSPLKTYCYVLRPLCCIRFIHTHGTAPHMEYRKNLAAIRLEASLLEHIHQLLQQKQVAVEGQQIPQNQPLLHYFRRETAWAEQCLSGLQQQKNRNYQLADEAFRTIIGMVQHND